MNYRQHSNRPSSNFLIEVLDNSVPLEDPGEGLRFEMKLRVMI